MFQQTGDILQSSKESKLIGTHSPDFPDASGKRGSCKIEKWRVVKEAVDALNKVVALWP